MRKRVGKVSLISLIASLLLLTAASRGQGTVNFRNTGPFLTEADRLVRDSAGNLLVGTNYLAQLYYGAPGSLEAQLIPVDDAPTSFRIPTTTSPGTWKGGVRTLNGFLSRDIVSLQVRVWDVAVGSSWEQASMAGFGDTQYGVSEIFDYMVPDPWDTSNTRGQMDNFRAFSLVPEPSILTLAVVGAFGLWFFGRRSKAGEE